MPEDFSHLNEDERLKAENEFMKMKLMLEKGAQFGMSNDQELPAGVKNEFLKNMVEYEKQFDEHKTIKVFDKIGRPTHFKPVAEIPDDEMDSAWKVLSEYLSQFGIDLSVCSPNISNRELYRFTIEELFDHEMDDMDIPGMMHGFIYDEFHPDPIYDNTRAAEDSIKYILQEEPMEWMHHFKRENLKLNEHDSLTEDECKEIVNRFKLAYDNLEISEINVSECIVHEKESWVKGRYSITATSGSETFQLSGNWKVVFENDEDSGYWYINDVKIEGINF